MYFVHDIPGRLRVKIEYLKNHPERLKEICKLLNVPGVFRVKSNSLTGSTVVDYDAGVVTSGHLLDILKTNGYAIDLEKNAVNLKIRETQEKMAMKVSKAAVSWLAGRVLEANGLSMVVRFI
jgi:copper chaperone CopZ